MSSRNNLISHQYVFISSRTSAQAAPWDHSDKFLSSGVKWLLERLAGMSALCREIITPTPTPSPAACPSPGDIGVRSGGVSERGAASGGDGSTNGGGSGGGSSSGNATSVMEERRKAARKRAMDMIEAKASAFARQIDMMAASSSSEGEGDKDGGDGGGGRLSSGGTGAGRATGRCASPAGGSRSSAGGAAAGRRGKQRLKRKQREHRRRRRRSSSSCTEQRPECIVCRDDADRGSLGYVGFGRRSQVLDVRPDGEERSPGVHLQVMR